MLGAKVDPDPRSQPTRQRVYDAIAQQPGRTFIDLVRALGFTSFGQAQYHLYVLERLGHIHHVKSGRSVHYYPTSGTTPHEAAIDAVAALEARRLILEEVRREPRLSVGRLAERLPFTRQNVAYHLERLEQAGLVVVEDVGRFRIVRPAATSDGEGTLGCEECRRGPCNAALMPAEACGHGCGCSGGPVAALAGLEAVSA